MFYDLDESRPLQQKLKRCDPNSEAHYYEKENLQELRSFLPAADATFTFVSLRGGVNHGCGSTRALPRDGTRVDVGQATVAR